MESTFCNWYNRNTKRDGATDSKIAALLEEIKTIAVVGLSPDPHRESHYIARYLKNAGYRIVPVNPTTDEVLGEKAYPDLQSIPFPVDVVDIFRRPEKIPDAVSDAIDISPKAIWLQLGTGSHPELTDLVEAKGIMLFQNRCIKTDHQFLIRSKQSSKAESAKRL